MAYYYDRMYKGDTEIRSLIANGKTLWTKNIPVEPLVINESKITIFHLDSSDKRVDVALETELITGSGTDSVTGYIYSSGDAGPLELYFGKDWVAANNYGITGSGMPPNSNIKIATLPDNLITVQGYLFNNSSALERCILTNTKLTVIPYGMFSSCYALIDIGIIPNTVASTQGGAVQYANNLATIEFADGENALDIGAGTFVNCSGIQNMTLPARTTSIASAAFAGSTIQNLVIDKPTDSISGYPWGAASIGTITWTGTA